MNSCVACPDMSHTLQSEVFQVIWSRACIMMYMMHIQSDIESCEGWWSPGGAAAC